MKAPMALKRVGRSIGVIRTKVSTTLRRSHTSRGGAALKKDVTEENDERDDCATTENNQQQNGFSRRRSIVMANNRNDDGDNRIDETDPADYLTQLRSGSASMEDVGADNFDRALTLIANERPAQVSLPPSLAMNIIEAKQEKLILSPPHVQENPMTSTDDDLLSSLDAAASNMVRSMSNLVSRSFSKLVEEANETVQDAVSFTEKKNEEPTQQEGEPTPEAATVPDKKFQEAAALVVAADPSTASEVAMEADPKQDSNDPTNRDLPAAQPEMKSKGRPTPKAATVPDKALEEAAALVVAGDPSTASAVAAEVDPKQDSNEPTDRDLPVAQLKKGRKKWSKGTTPDGPGKDCTNIAKSTASEESPEAQLRGRASSATGPATVTFREMKVDVEQDTSDAPTTTRPVKTPKPAVVHEEDDEDITVSTAGPDVVLPPTVQGNRSDSISDRAPIRVPSRASVIAAAFSNFGDRMCSSQGEEPGMLRVFDAFRDLLCCPEEQVAAPTSTRKTTNRPVSPAQARSAVKFKAQKKVESDENAFIQVADTANDEDFVSQCTSSDDCEEPQPVDSFDEIAQATILVSDMIKIKGSFTSEQCDQVERALKVLELQAKKIGVNECDLLAAMASFDDSHGKQSVKKVPSSIAMESG